LSSASSTMACSTHFLTRTPTEFLSGFAGIGLLLTAIGVFSVMAYSVSLQTHEIGVRLALDAQRGDILRMVLTKGLTLVIAGILIGFCDQFWRYTAAFE
jgi:ABC-type antimicrobial peptide transport system permease subunit